MKYINAEKLRAEIRRMLKDNSPYFDVQERTGAHIALAKLSSFLDTLSEEPDKSLEEAAYKYSFDSRPSIYGQVDVIDAFKAGAKWQASQMPMPEDTALFNKGVAEGRRLMMEEAVEGTVMDFSSNLPRPQVDIRLDPHKYHTGDKVRIVVLKKEE